jgi:ABC-2 type transport system ATP-binding protein
MHEPILQVTDLVRQYGDFTAVDNLSFEVRRGEIFGMLGPNGAGKSTTIRTIMGIFQPDSGRVRVLGTNPRAARHRVGYLPEERGLYRDLRVMEVLLYLAELKGVGRKTAEKRARRWLVHVNLGDEADSRVKDLSRGMHQKLQFVASLVHDPELLILDEPFQGLDPINVSLIKNLIRDLANAGKTIMLSAHEMSLVEALCDRILLMNKGRRVLYGELRSIKREYAAQTVRLVTPLVLEHIPGVTDITRQNGAYTLKLADETPPKAALQTLLEMNIPIEAYEVAAAPLEEIFISLVEEDPTP